MAGTPGASCQAQSVAFVPTDIARFTWTLPVQLAYAASAKVQVRPSGTPDVWLTLANTPVAVAGTRTQSGNIGNPRLAAGSWDWRMLLTEWDGTVITCDGSAFTVVRLPAPDIALSGPRITWDGWRTPVSGQVASVTPGAGDASVGSASLIRFQYASGSWTGTLAAPAGIPASEIQIVRAYRRTANGMTGDSRLVALHTDTVAPTMPVPPGEAVDVPAGGATVTFAPSVDWLSGLDGYQARIVHPDGEAGAWMGSTEPVVAVGPGAIGGELEMRACDRVGNCSAPSAVALIEAPPEDEPYPEPEIEPDDPPAPTPTDGTTGDRARRQAVAPRITALVPAAPAGGSGRVTVELSRAAEVTFRFRGAVVARAWLGSGRTLIRLPAQTSARRGPLTAHPVAGAQAGDHVTATVSLPGGQRQRRETARRATPVRPGAQTVLYDLDAAVREVVDPLDGAAGLGHRRGALRQEPSTSGLFAADDDAARMAKVTEEDLHGLSADAIAELLREEIDDSPAHLVAFDELTAHEADARGPVVKGGRIPPPDPSSPGAQFAQALISLDVPSPYGGTWASRVHVYIAPAVTSAMAIGRGPDRNWGRDGKARLRTYRTVMPGLARAGAIWIEAYHGRTLPLTPFTVDEWTRAPAAFTAEYRRAGGDPSRLHLLVTGTDTYPVGPLPVGCVTPQACQWVLAESTPAGRAMVANGVGGYRLAAHARSWLAEWQARAA